MLNYENKDKDIEKQYLDPISQIKIDSSQWIETIFITDRKLPNKWDIKRSYFDNKLLSKKEALRYANKHNIQLPEDIDNYNFFIYHQKLWIIPVKEWDYVITNEWYTTTDWKYVICHDNDWNELWFF